MFNTFNDVFPYFRVSCFSGVGKFSSVCECTHIKSNKKYAVKVIDRKLLDEREREVCPEFMVSL